MKKNLLCVLTLTLLALFTFQDVLADYCTSSAVGSNASRYTKSFGLSDGTNTYVVSNIQTSTTDNVYKDRTSDVFITTAGATLTPSWVGTWDGSWMHHYVYIDYTNDGTFSTADNEYVINPGTGTSDGSYSPSKLTAFNLPSDLEPGDYRLRYKCDWADTDPCGSSNIGANGGCIMDMTIRIVSAYPTTPAERTISYKQNNEEAGTISGGGTSAGPILLTAIPDAGYEFVNWTCNGDEVSTNQSFYDKSEEGKTYVANYRRLESSTTLDRTSWTATASSYHPNTSNGDGPPSYAIDGNSSRHWHTQYENGKPDVPHWIQFYLGSNQEFNKFNYVSRSANYEGANGNVREYSLYVSDTDISSNKDATTYVPTNATAIIENGVFTYGDSKNHNVTLDKSYSGSYVYMLITDAYSQEDVKFGSCDEFYLYKYISAAESFPITVSATAAEGGNAQISSESINSGEQVILTATPAEDYGFVNWTDSNGNFVSSKATCTLTVNATETYTANFAQKIIVTIESNDDAKGTVSFSEGEGTRKEVGSGASVTIIAEPKSNAYKFVQWEDGSTDATRQITNITESATYTATFADKQICKVTVATPEVAGGDVTYTVNEAPSGGTIYEGDKLVFTATEYRGYEFVEWSDGVNQLSANTEYTTTATTNMTIVPVYAELKAFTFEVEQPQGTTITVADSEGNDISNATVYERDEITISIAVDAIYTLNGLYVNDNQQGLDANNSVTYTLTDAIESPLKIRAEVTRFTQDEIYAAMAKPTLNTAGGNLPATQKAEILKGAIKAPEVVIAEVGMEGTDSIKCNHSDNYFLIRNAPAVYVSPGAEFNLQLKLFTNAYGFGMQFYLLHNTIDNPSESYGFYGNTGVGMDDFWTGINGDNRLTVNQENSTVIFPISLPETAVPGDVVVFRAMSSDGATGNPLSVSPAANLNQGTYLDIVFYVVSNATLSATANAEVKVTTDAPATIKVGTETYTTTDENLTATITLNATEEEPVTIEAIGASITKIDCGEKAVPAELSPTITEIELRNVNASETELPATIKKVTVVSDAEDNVATVAPTSDLSQGVQVVVEKEIKTPQTLDDGITTPTIFNFLSMPFAFNTADIKYWDGDSWETALPEEHVRILLYDSQKRANHDYDATWETITTETHQTVSANQGFVIVGNNDLGTTVKLQFTSVADYDGSVTSVTANRYRKESGETNTQDEDWNINGVPYLTAGEFAEDYTLYTYNNSTKSYDSHIPALGLPTLKPYQAVMYQAAIEGEDLTKEIAINSASISNANASENVYARAYISIDDSTPAKIILSDETSENFVVNEDAWYMPSLINTTPAAYFNVGGAEASVSVQPAANELPMTVYTGAGTSHRISLTATDGNYNVYLKDAATDETVCLNDEDYTFTATAKTTIADRFTVSMIEPTGITESEAEATIKPVVLSNAIKLYGTEEGDQVSLYTANGMIITNTVTEEGVTTIETTATGVIIIKVAGETVKVVK